MANLKFTPKDYAGTVARIPANGFTIGHNTRVTAGSLAAEVTLHGNTIATFRRVADTLYIPKWGPYEIGRSAFPVTATLDTCGWHTPTTHDRLIQMMPDCATASRIRLGLRRGQSYVTANDDGYPVPFDRLHFTTAGEVIAYHEGRPTRVA